MGVPNITSNFMRPLLSCCEPIIAFAEWIHELRNPSNNRNCGSGLSRLWERCRGRGHRASCGTVSSAASQLQWFGFGPALACTLHGVCRVCAWNYAVCEDHAEFVVSVRSLWYAYGGHKMTVQSSYMEHTMSVVSIWISCTFKRQAWRLICCCKLVWTNGREWKGKRWTNGGE